MTTTRTAIVIVLTMCCLGAGLSCSSGEGAYDAEPGPAQGAGFGTLSPLAPPQTLQWGRLSGVWNCVISTPGQGGQLTQSRATWTWRYVLDGHAIQDVYVGHRDGDRPDFYGTGLRVYHPETARWEISWVANTLPVDNASRITPFTATFENDQIVMRRANGDPEWRTVFYEIGEESFAWMSEPSGQTMRCRRKPG